MKNSKVKSVIGIVVMSVFFIAANTKNAHAQSRNNKVQKNKKEAVLVKNNVRSNVKKVRLVNVPQNASVVRHNNINYRFHNGNYYRPTNGGFIIANAPIGARVKVLPNGFRKVRKRGAVYYRVGRTYYRPIQQPRGGVVYEIVNF